MRLRFRWVVAALMVAGLALPACTRNTAPEEAGGELTRVQPIAGTGVSRVTLSALAARRLDIQTTTVREISVSGSKEMRKVIPYPAVVYDQNGETWTYTNPVHLVFVRQRISVDQIEGDMAVLSDGPPAGTPVVTVGAAELLGTEYAVGGE